jgi:adenylylsulfate kinase
MIILLFGQPASGKTTLANALYEDIWEGSWAGAVRIDGDRWRDITKNKDYSKEGRIRNLKGAFDMALYLEKDDYIPILSFVTPYEELRSYLRENAKNLVEIYLEYNGDRGRNQNFATDFEKPTGNYLSIDTSAESIEESLDKVIQYVFENGKLNIEDEI